MQTMRIYSQVIGMEFGIEKYPILIKKKNNGRNRTTKSTERRKIINSWLYWKQTP